MTDLNLTGLNLTDFVQIPEIICAVLAGDQAGRGVEEWRHRTNKNTAPREGELRCDEDPPKHHLPDAAKPGGANCYQMRSQSEFDWSELTDLN